MSHLSRSNIWNEYIFNFLFHDINARMFEFTSEWKLEMFGKSVKENEIVVRAHCLHTPFKGEVICEYQVDKHKNPKNCPSYGVWEKGYKDIDQWMLGWDIHAKTHETAPILIYTKDFDQTMGFISEDGDLWAFGVRNSSETHKTAPVLVFEEEFERWMLFQRR